MIEPFSNRTFGTFVSQEFPDRTFADDYITVPVVNPERTFLEKIFLLHEEFQRSPDKIRVDRLSRHLYDIEKLSQLDSSTNAIKNGDLYKLIVSHRRRFTALADINYDNHLPGKVAFLPPDHLLSVWENDYRQMQENMIYGSSLRFAELISKLQQLQDRINSTIW